MEACRFCNRPTLILVSSVLRTARSFTPLAQVHTDKYLDRRLILALTFCLRERLFCAGCSHLLIQKCDERRFFGS